MTQLLSNLLRLPCASWWALAALCLQDRVHQDRLVLKTAAVCEMMLKLQQPESRAP